MPHFVYILQSEQTGKFYIGSTQNLEERLKRHNQGRSVFTKPYRPWKIVYAESLSDRAAARKRERELKEMKSPRALMRLIEQS
jgi:putative endonuclease